MGAKLSNGDFDDNGDFEPINVTPMVDVVLVPLIIFMVGAPLMIAGVPVNLPQSRRQAEPAPKAARHHHRRRC